MTALTEDVEFHALCRNPLSVKPHKQGIYFNLNREVYDSIPFISATVLKQWIKTGRIPSKFGYWLEHRWEEEKSAALTLGAGLDCRMLDRALFPFQFCTVPPDAPKRPSKVQINAKKPSAETLFAIGYWNKFNEENKGKTVLTNDQMDAINGMEASLRKSPACLGLFENCKRATLIGEFNGYPAKAEVDLWNGDRINNHILDLKTADDCGETAFGYACDKFGYFEQATFYLSLARSLGHVEKRLFSWVVVESEPPYAVQVYTFDPDGSDEHMNVYSATLDAMKEAHDELLGALAEGIWEDTADWRPVRIPEWRVSRARKQLEIL